MNTKQQEQLKFIEIANDLNQEIYDKYGEVENKFYYSTDGYVDIFGFGDNMLWNSEMEVREWIEEKNDYEPFEPFIMRIFNEYIDKMHTLKF